MRSPYLRCRWLRQHHFRLRWLAFLRQCQIQKFTFLYFVKLRLSQLLQISSRNRNCSRIHFSVWHLKRSLQAGKDFIFGQESFLQYKPVLRKPESELPEPSFCFGRSHNFAISPALTVINFFYFNSRHLKRIIVLACLFSLPIFTSRSRTIKWFRKTPHISRI